MPTLMLLRHAKSSWDNESATDRDRPLSDRGRHDAEAMMAFIARDYCPDRVLCSPARRTRETLDALLPHIGEAAGMEIVDELYEPPGDYCDVIAKLGGSAERLMVIGHNPAIQATALAVAGSGDGALRTEIQTKFPTCALAVIVCPGTWSNMAPNSGRLIAFVRPRDLGTLAD